MSNLNKSVLNKPLIRVCKIIERHTTGYTWQELYHTYLVGFEDMSNLDKSFDLEWSGSCLANGQPRDADKTIVRSLWEALYPGLEFDKTRFQYSKPSTINPWNARPSLQTGLPLALRVEQDTWFVEHFGLELEEPDLVSDQPFEIIWED